MHKNLAVKMQGISKIYKLYDKPINRLKESLHPFKKKYHREFYALNDIHLEIKKGEILGIVGVNGAGKSTLLKIIAGVLTPTRGRVNIHGKVNAILELSSGLKGEMTGRENIHFNLKINGINEGQNDLAEEIIKFTDIEKHIDQPVKTYSSGMKARLGFGLATATDPDILIIDEVLAVGDALFRRKCYQKIENLFQNGKTVIFVSHSAQTVIEFCSRAVLLYDRSIILDDTPKKVTAYYQKLIFSKNKKAILNEIKNETILNSNNYTEKIAGSEKIKKVSPGKEVAKVKCYFSPLLKSTPTYVNKELASFYNIRINDSLNNKVNVLHLKERYTLNFTVIFHHSLEDVRFGMQINTLKGLTICGTNTKDYNNDV